MKVCVLNPGPKRYLMSLLWAAVARADDLYDGSCDDTSPSWSPMTLAQGELYKTIYSATYSSIAGPAPETKNLQTVCQRNRTHGWAFRRHA